MFISPIRGFGKINNKQQPQKQQTFKRKNYAEVFSKEFNRKIYGDKLVLNMFKNLSAAAKFPKTLGSDFFNKSLSQYGLLYNLLYLTKPGHADDYDKVIKNSMAGLPILQTDKDETIINIVNNGRYDEEIFIDRLLNGEKADVNIVFNGLDENSGKFIAFSTDFDGDFFVTRGTEQDPLQHRIGFYSLNGYCKEKIVHDPVTGQYEHKMFHNDGTVRERSFVDDFGELVNKTLNILTRGL